MVFTFPVRIAPSALSAVPSVFTIDDYNSMSSGDQLAFLLRHCDPNYYLLLNDEPAIPGYDQYLSDDWYTVDEAAIVDYRWLRRRRTFESDAMYGNMQPEDREAISEPGYRILDVGDDIKAGMPVSRLLDSTPGNWRWTEEITAYEDYRVTIVSCIHRVRVAQPESEGDRLMRFFFGG